MASIERLTEKFIRAHTLSEEEFTLFLTHWREPGLAERLAGEAVRLRRAVYGDDVYLRGLIEFTNHCGNDCLYCGLRKSNPHPVRYRMTKAEILSCCEAGYGNGFRTFVLQGGEDPYFTDERLAELVSEIKTCYPDCAVTLSVGERSYDSYRTLREAGADRYLLRHETADETHYALLHPQGMYLQTRINCLLDLKSLGYQVGAGFLVGSPHQKPEYIAEDLKFLEELQPEMVGIGPFLPHHDTPFAAFPAGSADFTLFLLSVIRILLPDVLLPATTALRSLDPRGLEKALRSGANVVMPNLSPEERREQYTLYDTKEPVSGTLAESLEALKKETRKAGFRIVTDRGDYRKEPEHGRQEHESDHSGRGGDRGRHHGGLSKRASDRSDG